MWVKGSLLSPVVGGRSYIFSVAPGMRLLAGDRVESLIDRGVIGTSHVIAWEAVTYSDRAGARRRERMWAIGVYKGNYVSKVLTQERRAGS
jgi:hypothetical protein